MVRFLGFLGGRPILTFRFRRERLPARESGVERVPPSDREFAALPAQVSDLIPDPRRKIHEPAVDVFQFTAEGVHLVDIRLHGAFEVRLFLEGFRVRLALLRGCGRESFPVVRFGVLDQLAQFSQAGELRIESQERLFETRNQRVRLRHREHAQQRVRVQAEIGRASHRVPRGIYRLRRTLLFAYVRRWASRTARAAATMFRSFAWASSTLRVLRPQSGSMYSFSGSEMVRAFSMRSRIRDSGSTTWLWTSTTPNAISFFSGSRLKRSSRSRPELDISRSSWSTGSLLKNSKISL